jgi:hypothetical protein
MLSWAQHHASSPEADALNLIVDAFIDIQMFARAQEDDSVSICLGNLRDQLDFHQVRYISCRKTNNSIA